MAKKNNDEFKYDIKKIQKLSSDIEDGIDSLYANTYFNTNKNNKDLENIKNNVNSAIEKIVSNNYNSTGNPSITNLYTRLNNVNNKQVLDAFENLFGDEQRMSGLLSTYTNQKYVRDLDQEIDAVCKYMPKLQEALNIKKDNVLTSDTYGKDFLNATNTSKTGDESTSIFNQRFEELKKNYNLAELLEKAYDNAAKYGEEFIYISPYNKEFADMINNKAKSNANNSDSISFNINEAGVVSFNENNQSLSVRQDIKDLIAKNKISNTGITIQLESGYISSVYKEETIIEKHKSNRKYSPSNFQKTVADDLKFDNFKDYDVSSTDGFVDTKEISPDHIKVNGCVVKRLKRDRVIPIYIENTCLGYYYFEMPDTIDDFGAQDLRDPLMALKKYTYTPTGDPSDSSESEIDIVLQYLSSQLSEVIDSKFIEANQDIKREIYMILKYNNLFNERRMTNIKVTYIPPENIHHIYFNMDDTTHRGISDLYNALLPAKLYSALYITNTIGVLTRGQDKRVYYVKQTVDTNISQSLINTINQIKKSNFGLREINSIGQVLNITGRYNDYFIPTSQGDPPIQFEIMQGQNIDIKTDLLQLLEEMAVNAVDTPLELIQARESMEYATEYIMSNTKFLRKVLKRQSICNPIFSGIISDIYNYEYGEHDNIEIKLPSPIFLRSSNLSTIIDNAKNYVEAIANYEYPDQDDEKIKQIFIKRLMRYRLQAHVDQTVVDKIMQESKAELSKQDNKEE